MSTPTSVFSRYTFIGCIIIIASAFLFNSCVSKQAETPMQRSALNVINTVVNGSSINFYINNRRVEGAILKPNEDSGYFYTVVGSRPFDVAVDGTQDYLIRTDVTFKQNTFHSIFITGEGSSVTYLFTEDNVSAPAAGKAKIRFANMTPDGSMFTLAIRNGSTLVTGQPYQSVSEFSTLDPGVYDLQLKNGAGTVLATINTTIATGKTYNVWSAGLESGVGNAPVSLHIKSID